MLGVAPAMGAPVAIERYFVPEAELWPRWTRRDGASVLAVEHGQWNEFLAKFRRAGPDGIARIAYRAVAPIDRARLDDYLTLLRGAPVDRLSGDQQLAYWINLYNALTVRIVLDRYPVASIRDIGSGGLFDWGPWNRKLFTVENETVSLNDIEHRILRPIWRDARLHYAVNCASLGCPNLAARAYESTHLDPMFEAAARDYVNHPRGAKPVADGLVVSKIYGWFAGDFGGGDGAVLDHLRRYAAPELRARIDGRPRIADYAYDWRLNDAPE